MEATEAAPTVRPWKAKGLRQYLTRFIRGHGSRWDLWETARFDGIATDLRFMLVLPAKERELYAEQGEGWGGKRPPWRDVIPRDCGPLATVGTEITVMEGECLEKGEPVIRITAGEQFRRVNPKYVLTILDRYPSADCYLGTKPSAPVVFKVGSEVVGLVMPFAD